MSYYKEELKEENMEREKMSERILCFNHGVHCMNIAVGEFDLADGKGVKFYCRKCVEEYSNMEIDDSDTYEIDESLVFCSREWDNQK